MEDQANQPPARKTGRPVAVKRSWQIYDGKDCATIVTVNNRIVSAAPPFRKYVGQLLATLPRSMRVEQG